METANRQETPCRRRTPPALIARYGPLALGLESTAQAFVPGHQGAKQRAPEEAQP